MTELKRQLFSVFTAGTLMLNLAAPAFADTTLIISGNGSNTDNTVNLNKTSTTTVVQENNAYVENKVDADADTGNNDANDNTNGDVDIETGDADVDVHVSNTLNKNVASVDCCDGGDTHALIEDNGTYSDNHINLEQESETEVFQENNAKVLNDVYADADTGDNDAEDNTNGDVSIETGDAHANVDVSTTANANWAHIGDGDENGKVSARIVGNGSHTDNEIDLDLDSVILLAQENNAYVENYVDADADTGNNDANDNTGGKVEIDTGDADVSVDVDNLLNFNWADLDCGCFFDVFAKIADNGTHSDNKIEAEFEDEREVFQENNAELLNDVDGDADSGHNDAEDNTGDSGSDPSITTGDADDHVDVENTLNKNVFGEGDSDSDWSDWLDWSGSGLDLHVSFNLSDLLSALGLD